MKAFIYEFGIKTISFGLKPGNYLIFNNPALKGGVINCVGNQGFSPNE
jgi:hypothetical protein